jgi:hypothetical protein
MFSEALLITITRVQLGLTVLVGLAAAPFSPGLARAEVLTGLLMAANFWALRTLTARIMGESKSKTLFALVLAFKHLLVLLVLAVFVLVLRLDGVGVALGVATLVAAITIGVVRGSLVAREPGA